MKGIFYKINLILGFEIMEKDCWIGEINFLVYLLDDIIESYNFKLGR